MTIGTDLTNIKSNFEQAQIALKYQKVFAEEYERIKGINDRVDEIKSSIEFDAIPQEVKSAFNKASIVFKQIVSAIESDADILALVMWDRTENL